MLTEGEHIISKCIISWLFSNSCYTLKILLDCLTRLINKHVTCICQLWVFWWLSSSSSRLLLKLNQTYDSIFSVRSISVTRAVIQVCLSFSVSGHHRFLHWAFTLFTFKQIKSISITSIQVFIGLVHILLNAIHSVLLWTTFHMSQLTLSTLSLNIITMPLVQQPLLAAGNMTMYCSIPSCIFRLLINEN